MIRDGFSMFPPVATLFLTAMLDIHASRSTFATDRGLWNPERTNHLGNLTLNREAHPKNETQLDPRADPCFKQPLRPHLWAELNMTDYLDNYPNGNFLNLEQYAAGVGATNFLCSIGQVCTPHQLCERVKGKDWYALVAAQNWNSFMNNVYSAAEAAFNNMRDIIPNMLIDFERDPSRARRKSSAWLSLISTWVSCFPSSLFGSVAPIPDSPWESKGAISWILFVGLLNHVSSFQGSYVNMFSTPAPDRWTRSTQLRSALEKTQDVVMETIMNTSLQVITSPVSSRQGLSGVNRDGVFCDVNPIATSIEIEEEYEKALKARTLSWLWRRQNAFIARGSEPCIHEGPNGAISGKDIVSYCGTDNIMMIIYRAQIKGAKAYNRIYNMQKVELKYSMSIPYLLMNAWECQKNYKEFSYEPYIDRKLHTKNQRRIFEPGDCYFDLPVCDCTVPEIREALKSGHSIVKVCRELGKLAI